MAENLARIIGSEDDKVNCPFYFKNGACRYGNRCTRQHIKPTKSPTLLFAHLYHNPSQAIALAEGNSIPDEEILVAIKHLESFYSEIFMKVCQFGEIEEMHVVDNLGEHMQGNVFIRFKSEADAESAKQGLSGLYYDSILIMPEFSPVTDFYEGRCREFDDNRCRRGSHCNFMHIKKIRKELLRALMKYMYIEKPQFEERR